MTELDAASARAHGEGQPLRVDVATQTPCAVTGGEAVATNPRPDPGAAPRGPGAVQTRLSERLKTGDVTLPVLPESATQVVAATQDADVDARRLVDLLDRDPVLASQILRMANSAAYATRGQVVSLRQAVTHLGLRTVGDLALAASVRAAVFSDPRYARELRAVWRHAAASAAFAREAARLLRAPVESAFLCGLLHTIGKPFVLRVSLDVAAEVGVELPLEEVLALVDELHVPAGKLLAASWKLPSAVVLAIAAGDTYERSDDPLPMITVLAGRLATFLLGPGLQTEDLRDHPVFADLNLYPEDVETLVEKADAILSLVDASSA